MNVLILTPDAVGSTLLQRLITIYMQFHEFDHPVINLHELTNGLEKFYSSDFNQEMLGKPRSRAWSYYQSLSEIVDLLESVDHYKTARLAQYHIKSRQDSIADQTPFYQYLNDNFFIIACHRRNLFEHALSWGLNNLTKKLNVYNFDEKIDTFYDYYKNPIELDTVSLLQTLDRYKNYLIWAGDNFNIASHFYYEDHLPDIEKFILNLPIFNSQRKKITWNDTFNIEFKTWNRMHYYRSNIGSLALDKNVQLLENHATDGTLTRQEILARNLPSEQQELLKKYSKEYTDANDSIKLMHKLGILVSTVPIKKQTFAEKRHIIKNFDQCLEVYNQWAIANPDIADPYFDETINLMLNNDQSTWKEQTNLLTKN